MRWEKWSRHPYMPVPLVALTSCLHTGMRSCRHLPLSLAVQLLRLMKLSIVPRICMRWGVPFPLVHLPVRVWVPRMGTDRMMQVPH